MMNSSASLQAPLVATGVPVASQGSQRQGQQQQHQSSSEAASAKSLSMSGRLRGAISLQSDDPAVGGLVPSGASIASLEDQSASGGRSIRQRVRHVQHRLSNRLIEVYPPMTQEQALTLSPWQKYKDFNRFPFKFVLQMVLLALVTAQTGFYASSVLPYFNQVCGSRGPRQGAPPTRRHTAACGQLKRFIYCSHAMPPFGK